MLGTNIATRVRFGGDQFSKIGSHDLFPWSLPVFFTFRYPNTLNFAKTYHEIRCFQILLFSIVQMSRAYILQSNTSPLVGNLAQRLPRFLQSGGVGVRYNQWIILVVLIGDRDYITP